LPRRLLLFGIVAGAAALSSCVQWRSSQQEDQFWQLVDPAVWQSDPVDFDRDTPFRRFAEARLARDAAALVSAHLPAPREAFIAFLVDNGFRCYPDSASRSSCFYQGSDWIAGPISFTGRGCARFRQALFVVSFEHGSQTVNSAETTTRFAEVLDGTEAECREQMIKDILDNARR
jgi:hypothetical protein